MTIHLGMWNKAQRLIVADAEASYRHANTTRSGTRRKRHVPYSLPERSTALVEALGTGDADLVAGIMLYRFGDGTNTSC